MNEIGRWRSRIAYRYGALGSNPSRSLLSEEAVIHQT